MSDLQPSLSINGITIERCRPEVGLLQRRMRDLCAPWLLIGQGLDDATAVALVRTGRAVRSQLHVGLLGAPDDARSYQRWARRGCSLYLVSQAAPERVAFALSAVIAHDVVIIDRAFYPGPTNVSLAAPPRITSRERDVLELVVGGLRTKEIAARLHLSENTVESHLRSLYAKLQVSTRAGAVNKAISSGAI